MQGNIAEETPEIIDALDQVLFHLCPKMDSTVINELLHALENGQILSAAMTMASVAAKSRLALSTEDRTTLRRVIEAHGGDRTAIGQLDSLASTDTPTLRIRQGPMRGNLA